MNSLALFFLILAIISFVIGYYKNYQKCPKTKIEYRYIPRTFQEEQLTVPDLKNRFNKMFNNISIRATYPTNSIE